MRAAAVVRVLVIGVIGLVSLSSRYLVLGAVGPCGARKRGRPDQLPDGGDPLDPARPVGLARLAQ